MSAGQKNSKNLFCDDTLFSVLREGVLLCEWDGRVVFFNSSAAATLGKNPEDLHLSQLFSTAVSENKRQVLFADSNLQKLLEKRMASVEEVLGYVGPAGEIKWLLLRACPMAAQFLITFIDISERKNLQEVVARQEQQITTLAKMAALGEVASVIAHEINNPLMIIQFQSERLRTVAKGLDEKSRPPLHKVADDVARTVERIAKITTSLLRFAREESQTEGAPIRIAKLLEDAGHLCQDRLKGAGTRLEMSTVRAELEVYGNETQLSQCLLNMVGNSADAIESLDERWIRIEVVIKGEAVEIAVVDSGKGIPRDVQKKMFQPFFTTKDVGRGTGLGMSVSKGIIENHAGRMYIDNESPNTRVVMVLPLYQSQQEAA